MVAMNFKNLVTGVITGAWIILAAGCGGSGTSGDDSPTAPASHTVGGSVYGLLGTLVLQIDGGEAVTLTTDGTFTFPTALPTGSTYSVIVQTQPATQICTVVAFSGTIVSADVTDVTVNCSIVSRPVQGTVMGLAPTETVVLQNNAGDDLVVADNGDFAFVTPIAKNGSYNVSVLMQPASQTCTVMDGSGIVTPPTEIDVQVICSTNVYTVGASGSHVAVSPSSAQTVASGATTSFSVTADGAYNLSLTVGGTCAAGSWSGSTYTTGAVTSDCTVTFAAGATVLYVSSDSTQALYKCLFNASDDPDVNGTLNTCVQTPSNQFWSPFASVGLKVNGTNRLYVADNMSNLIAFAPADADGGLGSDPAPSAGIQFNTSPTGITHARVQGVDYFYVSDNVGGDLYRCTIDAITGGFIMCTPTPTSHPSWTPFSTTVAEVNGVQYAYVAGGSSDHSVYQCQIDVDGTLINPCNVTPAGAPTGSWNPDGIAFATVNNIQYAYVASDFQDIYQCALSSDGSFTACASASGGGIPWDPRSISFATINNIQYAYVADISGSLYLCALYVTNDSTNGTFQNCTVTMPSSGPTPIWSPRGVNVFELEL